MRKLKSWERETYTWHDIKLCINVSKAYKLVGYPNVEPHTRIMVKPFLKSSLIMETTKWEKSNLREPVLVAIMGRTHFLVDGTHRIRKAIHLGRKTLPCFVLTERQTVASLDTKADLARYHRVRDVLDALTPPAVLLENL